jgi:hypothetical protein
MTGIPIGDFSSIASAPIPEVHHTIEFAKISSARIDLFFLEGDQGKLRIIPSFLKLSCQLRYRMSLHHNPDL